MKAPTRETAEQKSPHDQTDKETTFVVLRRDDVCNLHLSCLHKLFAERDALLKKLAGALVVPGQCSNQTGDNVSNQIGLKSLKELYCWMHSNKKRRLSTESDDVGEQMMK